MTDQITVPRETWGAMREALEEFIAKELTFGQRYTNEGQALLDALRVANDTATYLRTLELKLPGGKLTDQWESARVADYNQGWNDYRKAAKASLTAANAVSEPKSLFVDLIASHGPDFVDEMAAIDVEPEALITVESSLRFRLECEQQKSTDLLDEVRELKGKLLKARQPQAQGEAQEFQNGYDTGYEAGVLHASQATEPAPQEWISVDDQMPPPMERVLASEPRHRTVKVDMWFGPDFQWSYTHWMPLPAAPEAKQ